MQGSRVGPRAGRGGRAVAASLRTFASACELGIRPRVGLRVWRGARGRGRRGRDLVEVFTLVLLTMENGTPVTFRWPPARLSRCVPSGSALEGLASHLPPNAMAQPVSNAGARIRSIPTRYVIRIERRAGVLKHLYQCTYYAHQGELRYGRDTRRNTACLPSPSTSKIHSNSCTIHANTCIHTHV